MPFDARQKVMGMVAHW